MHILCGKIWKELRQDYGGNDGERDQANFSSRSRNVFDFDRPDDMVKDAPQLHDLEFMFTMQLQFGITHKSYAGN